MSSMKHFSELDPSPILTWQNRGMGQTDRPAGLRERKKMRTRDAIRRAAMQLIESNGYARTTVEQIAEAAEVSPATFFRYFPTKASAVISDALDQIFVAAMASQPAEIPTAAAFRHAVEVAQTTAAEDGWEFERSLRQLVLSVPELRELQLDEHRRTAMAMTAAECRRIGRDPDDFTVHLFLGAAFEAGLSVLDHRPQISEHVVRVIEFVEAGIPLGGTVPHDASAG